MTVRWTPTALRDLEWVHAYIASDNESAAARMIDTLLEAIDALTRHPNMGRRGRVPGTREMVVAPYVIAYGVTENAVEVLAVIHGARQWPKQF